MRTRGNRFVIGFALVLTGISLLIGGSSYAGTTTDEFLSVVTVPGCIERNTIEWLLQAPECRRVLMVSGPGEVVVEKYFDPGVPALFTPYEENGEPLPDGSYNYELRILSEDLVDRTFGEDIEMYDLPSLQIGSFSISEGNIIITDEIGVSDADEMGLRTDVLHYDDVIITGSQCIGFDCANGESFGYCTAKLKENNLQLCFEDTSAGSFPTNDWKIQVNDTTSGGGNYFTIWDMDGGRRPFTIEAGAPAHSLYVEDYGRIGLGTSIPYVELHIVDGDSPTIRLDQDGSIGWTAQRWDMCGNETNFFVRDVTNGSKMCFRIQPNTPSNTLCLRSSGHVGIGTWSPAYELDIVGQLCASEGLIVGSSRDLKQNIKELTSEDAFKTLQKLAPVTYQYKTNQSEGRVGFIAEEVPDMVAVNGRKGLSSMDIVAVLTKVLQDQQQLINDQKKALQDQQQIVNDQKKALWKLDNKLTNIVEELSFYNY